MSFHGETAGRALPTPASCSKQTTRPSTRPRTWAASLQTSWTPSAQNWALVGSTHLPTWNLSAAKAFGFGSVNGIAHFSGTSLHTPLLALHLMSFRVPSAVSAFDTVAKQAHRIPRCGLAEEIINGCGTVTGVNGCSSMIERKVSVPLAPISAHHHCLLTCFRSQCKNDVQSGKLGKVMSFPFLTAGR